MSSAGPVVPDSKDYSAWSVAAFRLASSGVRDETQIHTHMCYCDVIESIAAFDADGISMDASRSQNEVGPAIWDIHPPRVPDVPHCGHKTRRWATSPSPTLGRPSISSRPSVHVSR